MFLTREQAVTELAGSGIGESAAHAILDAALRLYPQPKRTAFLKITGYRKGTIEDAPGDLFTISSW